MQVEDIPGDGYYYSATCCQQNPGSAIGCANYGNTVLKMGHKCFILGAICTYLWTIV